jgi:hypothetical protein
MKILLVYKSAHHVWPILNAAECMSALDITIECHGENSPVAALNHLSGSFDALLIHQELMSEDVLACGRPVIILDRIDGAQLSASRQWLPHVSAVCKGYSYRDPQDHNRFRGRMLAHRLKEAGVQATVAKESRAHLGQPSPQLSEADLAKIHVWYGFGAYEKHIPIRHAVDFRATRETSVHFAGTVEYAGSEIETHRRLAAEVADSITDGIGKTGRYFRRRDYAGSMAKSKSVLCPFGWGESTHRDYEALLLGCVMIKPDCSFIESWPEIYVPSITYLVCQPDFSDVPDLVERVVANWKDFRRWRIRAHRIAMDAGSPPKIAARLKELLGRVL